MVCISMSQLGPVELPAGLIEQPNRPSCAGVWASASMAVASIVQTSQSSLARLRGLRADVATWLRRARGLCGAPLALPGGAAELGCLEAQLGWRCPHVGQVLRYGEVLERAMYKELGNPAKLKRPDEIARDQVISDCLCFFPALF